MSEKENIFTRNPKLTIFITFMMLAWASLATLDAFVAKRDNLLNLGVGEQRFVTLRERSVGLRLIKAPISEGDLAAADSLGKTTYTLEVDENGFIKPSVAHLFPDSVIAFLGGSTTELQFVEPENRFAAKAVSLIQESSGKKINSINAACSGNSSIHSLDNLLNKLTPLHPNVIVFMHSFNDLIQLMYTKGTYWDAGPRGVVVRKSDLCQRYDFVCSVENFSSNGQNILLSLSHGLGLFAPHLGMKIENKFYQKFFAPRSPDEWTKIKKSEVMLDEKKLLKTYRTNLKLFVSMARAIDAKPVLVTEASRIKRNPDEHIRKVFKKQLEQRDLGISFEVFTSLFELFNEEIRTVAKEENVLLVDLAKLIPQDREYIADLVHFNDKGSLLASTHIAKALRTLIH